MKRKKIGLFAGKDVLLLLGLIILVVFVILFFTY